jgi:hypothetical protein
MQNIAINNTGKVLSPECHMLWTGTDIDISSNGNDCAFKVTILEYEQFQNY